MVRLVISDQDGSTTVVPLLRDEVTIGRKEGNTIRLTERNISRRHVQLLRTGGVYRLRDLDSYNGVLVNGRKVEGETVLNNGDQIQIGDYSMVVEEDLTARPAMASQATFDMPGYSRGPTAQPGQGFAVPGFQAGPGPSAPRRPGLPARLVMLTPPAAGAEFVLPTDRPARLGRSDDVDCPINHRSVSREHAVITPEGDEFTIEDLDSANGVNVNGRPIKRTELRSGDHVELGHVVFRFVGAGEHYFFDVTEAGRYRGSVSGPNGGNLRLAVLLGAVILTAFVFLLLPSPQPAVPSADPDTYGLNDKSAGSGESDPLAPLGDRDPTLGAAAGTDDGFEAAVLACRSALASQRFTEAEAHASMALKLRPTASDALDCKRRASAQSEEERAYVRGKDALTRADFEQAYQEFSRLPESSVFRDRPEIASAATNLAQLRLDSARRALLANNRSEAARLAQSVLGLRGVSATQLASAQQMLSESRGEPVRRDGAARGPGTSSAGPSAQSTSSSPASGTAVASASRAPSTSTPTSGASGSLRSAGSGNAGMSRAAKAPESGLEPPSQHIDARPVTMDAPSGGNAFEAANACLARGDNDCVVRALEGKASTKQELGLLIETYRTLGDSQKAQKHMTTFVSRFPNEKLSDTYRRLLQQNK